MFEGTVRSSLLKPASYTRQGQAMRSSEPWECPSVPGIPTEQDSAAHVNLPGGVEPVDPPVVAPDAKVNANCSSKAYSVVLANDLPAAIEMKLDEGHEGVKVLYPKRFHKFRTSNDMTVHVCLRDDPNIKGTCQITQGASTIHASKSFGPFGVNATEYLQNEKRQIQKEHCLQQVRTKRIENAIAKERFHSIFFYFPVVCLCTCLGIVILGFCILVEPENAATAAGLSFGLVVVLCCLAFCGSSFQTYGARFASRFLRWLAFHSGSSCFVLAAFCVTVAVARYMLAGFWWTTLIAGLPCICLSALMGMYFSRASLEEKLEFEEDDDKRTVAERTLVFHGSILEGSNLPCICSWPGKYESAWDALVTGSRKGNLSAAVVFLPEGSEHFGTHDPIPQEEDLPGTCWCIPLYGEQKPWGCTWWTKWMRNIEQAVEQGAELEVYFFAGMKGKGKIESFLTAGKESLRREAILRKKREFLKSHVFRSADKGIQRLWKQTRSDGSSQYSREIQRLFLAWLSEEDRSFIEASDGLGNSQKAEVAWLERKGYAYTEVDVSAWLQ